jgi:hypothetical protein
LACAHNLSVCLLYYPQIQHGFGIINLSNDPVTSIESLIKAANDNLKHWAEEEPKIDLSLASVSLWLLLPAVLEVIEVKNKIQDISQITPGSRVNIEVDLNFSGILYRMVIKTLVNQSGALQLMHSEITDITFPYSKESKEEGYWEMTKNFAIENAVPLAGLMLSIFNASVNVLRLMGRG